MNIEGDDDDDDDSFNNDYNEEEDELGFNLVIDHVETKDTNCVERLLTAY